MTDEVRRDLYRVVALLRELERALHPLAGGERGELRVLPVVPAPLPPTGEPGAAARRSGGTPARPASEWSQRAVPPTARDPITVPWVEPAPIPPSGVPTPNEPVASAAAADAIGGADIVGSEPGRAPKPVDRGQPLARGPSVVAEGVHPTNRTEPADTRSPAPRAAPPLPIPAALAANVDGTAAAGDARTRVRTGDASGNADGRRGRTRRRAFRPHVVDRRRAAGEHDRWRGTPAACARAATRHGSAARCFAHHRADWACASPTRRHADNRIGARAGRVGAERAASTDARSGPGAGRPFACA